MPLPHPEKRVHCRCTHDMSYLRTVSPRRPGYLPPRVATPSAGLWFRWRRSAFLAASGKPISTSCSTARASRPRQGDSKASPSGLCCARWTPPTCVDSAPSESFRPCKSADPHWKFVERRLSNCHQLIDQMEVGCWLAVACRARPLLFPDFVARDFMTATTSPSCRSSRSCFFSSEVLFRRESSLFRKLHVDQARSNNFASERQLYPCHPHRLVRSPRTSVQHVGIESHNVSNETT